MGVLVVKDVEVQLGVGVAGGGMSWSPKRAVETRDEVSRTTPRCTEPQLKHTRAWSGAVLLALLQAGRVRYPVRAINVLKATGQSSLESQLIKGYAINCARAAQGMPTR